MLWSMIGAIIVGAIIGGLARLLLPGKQNISILVTILLGMLGSTIATWLVYRVGYHNSNGGFEIVPAMAGIVVAGVLILGYCAITGKNRA